MNINSKNFATQPAGVSSVSDPKLFDSFNDADCSAAIWARDVPLDKQAWINGLERRVLPTGRVIIPTNLVTETVTNLFDISGLPHGPNRTWFERDITSLAIIFSEVVKSKYLRLRFNVVETCMCPKFHVDSITARLICTYRGMGTQYGISERGEDPKHVYTLETGVPILLKGLLWPTKPTVDLLHRSPPTNGKEETRLIMVLDHVIDPEEEF